jgi:ATP-dependent Clp protease ATP-binding subunit ClpC
LTSNLGLAAGTAAAKRAIGFEAPNAVRPSPSPSPQVDLTGSLRREFVDRIDEILVLRSLDPEDLKKIAVLMIRRLHDRLRQQHIDLHVTDSALELIVAHAVRRDEGARELRRVVDRLLEEPLSQMLLTKELMPDQMAFVDGLGGTLAIRAVGSLPDP